MFTPKIEKDQTLFCVFTFSDPGALSSLDQTLGQRCLAGLNLS